MRELLCKQGSVGERLKEVEEEEHKITMKRLKNKERIMNQDLKDTLPRRKRLMMAVLSKRVSVGKRLKEAGWY